MIKNSDLESIINHAESNQLINSPTHNSLLDIYEGNLKSHVESSMQLEFNPNAFQVAKERIAPINILKRTTDKLAKVYSQGVDRGTAIASDESLVHNYEDILDLNNVMSKSDSMLNLLRSVAFEPYIKDGIPILRRLNPNQFTVWSNDEHDSTNPTVFVKYFGTITKTEFKEDSQFDRSVNVYILYDADEFIKIDSDLNIISRQDHDFGRIPFTYMNLSISNLVPSPDEDSLCMSILIPKLLSDLNYASKYLSHGIRYGIDIDVKDLEGNPDAFWVISSQDKEGSKPEIGVLSPSVDIDKVLNLTKEELIMYLEARSLKVGSSGKFDNNASGFAKLIDSADVTDVRKENMLLFKSTEKDLWNLISIMHNVWVENEEIEVDNMSVQFSSIFKISIKYGDLTPIVDPKEKREDLAFRLQNRFITYDRAVREANPDLTPEEQDQLIEELKLEKDKLKESDDLGREVDDKDSEGSEG